MARPNPNGNSVTSALARVLFERYLKVLPSSTFKSEHIGSWPKRVHADWVVQVTFPRCS